MAPKGCERLLPLPCGSGKHRSVECLRTTLATNVAAHSTPSQSTTKVVEPDNPDLQALDSRPTRSASLSYRSLPRHSSKVGAVCVAAPRTVLCGGRSVMIVSTASFGKLVFPRKPALSQHLMLFSRYVPTHVSGNGLRRLHDSRIARNCLHSESAFYISQSAPFRCGCLPWRACSPVPLWASLANENLGDVAFFGIFPVLVIGGLVGGGSLLWLKMRF